MVVLQALGVGVGVLVAVLIAALGYVVLGDLLGTTRPDDGGRHRDDRTESADGRRASAPGDATDAAEPVADARASERNRPPATTPGGPWWRRLGLATLLAWVILLAWPLPLAAFDVTSGANLGTLSTVVAVGVLGLLVVTAVVRLLLVPTFLWLDIGAVRKHGGDWHPSRLFYMGCGAVSATLTCSYYLYKRHKRVGEPAFSPAVTDVLAYRGPVASNWWYVVALALATGPVVAGLGVLAPATDLLPTAVALPVEWAVLLVLAGALSLRFLFLPVAFWKGATAVRAANVDWSPNPWLYAVVGSVFALPVGAYYLYRRLRLEERGPGVEGAPSVAED